MKFATDAFKALSDGAPKLQKKPGDILCQQGDTASTAWLLIEGSVSVWVSVKLAEQSAAADPKNSKGKQVAVRHAGDLVGEMSLFSGQRSATLVAETPITFAQIDHAALLHWVSNQPAASLALLSTSFDKVVEADTRQF